MVTGHELSRRIVQESNRSEENAPLTCLAWDGQLPARGGRVSMADVGRSVKVVEVTCEEDLGKYHLIGVVKGSKEHPLFEAVAARVKRTLLG
jgi:hypothetical protein